MNWLDLIPKGALGAVILVLLTTNVTCAYKKGQLEIEVSRAATKIAEIRRENTEALLTAQKAHDTVAQKYRAKEQALQAAMDTQRKTTDETITALAAQRDALRLRLQTAAPDTPVYTGAPSDSSFKAATTGGDFTLVHSEVGRLIDEAYRADQIRVELLGCYAAYDNAFKSNKE